MDDRPSGLDLQVAELSRSVADLEARLAVLEGRAPLPAGPAFYVSSPDPVLAAPVSESDLALGAGLVGRTLLALGGAYLLRALTAAGILPQAVGVLLALLYALVWLTLADRAGRLGRTASAGFHGATAVLIGFPLLWEATARFHYLGPAASGAAVGIFAALGFAVAWRRRLPVLGWLVGAGAALAAFALISATQSWVPFEIDLFLVGVAGIALAYQRGWHGLGWALGLVAHLAVAVMLLAVLVGGRGPSREAAVGLGLALVKGIVDLHGGRAHAHSEGIGCGAMFTIELPVLERGS